MEQIFGGMKDLTLAQECARAVLIFFYGLMMKNTASKPINGICWINDNPSVS